MSYTRPVRQIIKIVSRVFILVLAVVASASAQAQPDWTEPFPPFRIAGNLLKDRFRQNKGRIFLEIEEQDIASSTDPAGELAADETGRLLQEGLRRLPRLQREVFLLRVQQGLEYAEIASTLGSTTGAARVHYHHAVKRLKELLA